MKAAAILRLHRWRIARFVAVGIINTAFSYGVFALMLAVSSKYDLDLVIATLLGILFAFRNSKKHVFQSKRSGRFVHFLSGYGLTFLVNLALFHGLLAAGFHALAAQAVSLPLLVVFSYMINAKFVFPSDSRP